MASLGLSRSRADTLSGWDHVQQSMADILGTMVGAAVLRRDYGSILPRLVDEPMTEPNIMRVIMATAIALAMWEPRIEVQRVTIVTGTQGGRIHLRIGCVYLPNGHLGDRTTRQAMGDIDIII
jgi:phage baseplate assembly protein W